MNRLLLALLILLALGFAYYRTHPPQPWDFDPPALPVGTDELLYPNQV